MRPRERREAGDQDLFRSRLDQIIDMKHPLLTLGRTEHWRFLEERFGEVSTGDPSQPPPTRLIAALAILRHYDLSGEVNNCHVSRRTPKDREARSSKNSNRL